MDIDIDFSPSFDVKDVFSDVIIASRVENGKLVKHNVGAYFQRIPVDSQTGLSAIPYDRAEEFGYFKIDFLHLHNLKWFESKEEIRTLVKTDPDWSLLQKREVVEKLFQIKKHYDIVSKVKPKSVVELADTIALIRPGKRQFLKAYLNDKKAIRPLLFQDTGTGYFYKKSHAISYALTIVLELHLIKGGVI